MHRTSLFVFLNLVASLGTCVVATTLYRGDSRSARTIFGTKGFKAKGYDRPEGTLFQHVEKSLKHPSRDPFISTSIDIDAAKKHAGDGYLYFIDDTKITENIFDCAEEYKKVGKTYPYPEEKEFAVNKSIPWDAITKVQKKKDGEWKTIKLPSEVTPNEPDFPPEPTTLVVIPSPTPEPAAPPYEPGTCCFHLNQYDTCENEHEDLTCEITLLDNAKKEIGHIDRTSCNNDSPLSMSSKLPSELIAIGEHQNDYIQFKYGALAFPSSDKAHCSEGGWDPRENLCALVSYTRKRQMDCCFAC